MKNKFKIFIFLLLISPINILAKENYKIENIYINAVLNDEGNLTVQEGIITKGKIEKFSNNFKYVNDDFISDTWEDKNIDFEGSSFYNGTGISFNKMSAFKIEKDDIDWKVLETAQNKLAKEKNSNNKNKQNIYETTEIENGKKATLYYKNNSGYTIYYFEYEIEKLAVIHNDTGEIYWQIFDKDFDNVSNVNVQLLLPGKTKKSKFKYWAHGSLKGEIAPISSDIINTEEDFYKGIMLSIEDYKKGNSLDVRILFDKKTLNQNVELNNSNDTAYEEIINIEKNRANNSENKRGILSSFKKVNVIMSITYILGIIILWIIIYFKNKKSKKIKYFSSTIKAPISDYSMGIVDYLLNKEISKESCICELIRLIYSGNIKVSATNEEITLYNRASQLKKSEQIIIDNVFKGQNNLKLSQLIVKIKNDPNLFNNLYENWKQEILREFNQNNFITSNKQNKLIGIIYFILGMILILYNFIFKINNFFIILTIVIMGIAFLIYVLNLDNKTKRGMEHYLKWLDFKKYLKNLVLEENRETIKESNLPYYILFKIDLTINFADKLNNDEFTKVYKIYDELINIIETN